MPRFEKQVSDEQIASARARIAAGATLRAAAAEIPCAPSTLSYRIKRAEQAEAVDAFEASADSPPVGTVLPAGLVEVVAEPVGPLEVLRDALQATKADGQPDWGTRISAARTLGSLRPQELEPKPDKKQTHPEITVFDLPPGSNPVLHRAIEDKTGDTEVKPAEPGAAHSGPPGRPRPSTLTMLSFRRASDLTDSEPIGSWMNPAEGTDPKAGMYLIYRSTADRAVADHWRSELAAGRLPPEEDESEAQQKP